MGTDDFPPLGIVVRPFLKGNGDLEFRWYLSFILDNTDDEDGNILSDPSETPYGEPRLAFDAALEFVLQKVQRPVH